MHGFFRHKLFLSIAVITVCIISYSLLFNSDTIDYNTQVKPIFNKKCIVCHGGVKRKAGFSLLFRSDALAVNESGKPAIVPGDPSSSEMIRRISSDDTEERMPYKAHPLPADEVKILTQWIRQGAKWGDHWAYVPVKEEIVPVTKGALWGLWPAPVNSWVRNDIDYFILDKLKEQKLQPSAQADKYALLRRLSLDLTGLPAPKHLAEQYLANPIDSSYEELVDSLLALPSFGERWTAMWLDLSRYADTKGYEKDEKRNIWRYRDWLIKSFNNDKPYDSFLVEQIAGDMLPDASNEQLIATAFHRNTMTNDEGGTDNEEYRTAAVIDRVNTTWEALMGTTFGCVQCHSHPYDPFRHEEYYKFMAFFNNSRDEDTQADYPLLHEYKKDDSLRMENLGRWLTENTTPTEREPVLHFLKTWQPAVNSLMMDSFVNSELGDTKWVIMRKTSSARLRNIDMDGKTKMLFRYVPYVSDGQMVIHTDSPDGPVIASLHIPGKKDEWTKLEVSITPVTGIHDLYITYHSRKLKKQDDNGVMFDWFYFSAPFPGSGKPGYDSAKKLYNKLINSNDVIITPVMEENPQYMQRTTHVFDRGNWLAKGKEVTPSVPGSLNKMPTNAPANRYGLAVWITDKKNPLTARTMVNRIWEQFFGQGLAETLEDLGTQGIPPTHLELLNYLSWKLMNDYKWSLKKLMKEIVMSATYRQDSKVGPDQLRKDQFNRYYARGSRVRLSAEQIRDQALAFSGKLSAKMYGPSVMPWQPNGIWSSPYSSAYWQKNIDDGQYRRAIYTYWKRTSPYPSMLNFDAVAREVCSSRRIRTNTPLQALTLMNDFVYVDLSRQFAIAMKATSSTVPEQISQAFYIAAGRPISTDKLQILVSLYQQAFSQFSKDPDKTCEVTGLQDENNNPETAALVVVMQAILNLDEVITKS